MGRPESVGPVAHRMLRALAAGAWPEGSVLPSSRRLAREFNVSCRTAMAAVRRLAGMGLVEVRQRHPVRIPSGAQGRARGLLSPRRSHDGRGRLAILIHELWTPPRRNAFYETLMAGIRQEAHRRSRSVEVFPVPIRQQVQVVEQVLSDGYQAAVFLCFAPEYMASIIRLYGSRFPVLVFNRRIPGYELPSVTFDGYSASQAMVRHLADLGHRNLCMVASHDCHAEVEPSVKGHGKTVGWVDALMEHGLFEQCTMPVYVTWDHDSGIYEGVFRHVLRSPDRPTAIVFSHSPLARRFLADPEFSRLAVPDDISLATFEPATNIPQVRERPPLTSINIDPHRTAQCVLETLEKMIAGAAHPPTIRVPLTIELTESIGPARVQTAGAAFTGR